jgi:hypothetical protein
MSLFFTVCTRDLLRASVGRGLQAVLMDVSELFALLNEFLEPFDPLLDCLDDAREFAALLNEFFDLFDPLDCLDIALANVFAELCLDTALASDLPDCLDDALLNEFLELALFQLLLLLLIL